MPNSFLAFLPQGRSDNPAQQEIELTTAPNIDCGTHWGQQVCITKQTFSAFPVVNL